MVTNYLRFSIYNNIHLHVYLICSLHLMQLSLSHSLMETTTISSSTPFLTLDHKIREPSGTVACPAALSTPSAKCGCHPPIPHPRGFLSLPHSHRHGLSPSSLAFVTRGASAEAEQAQRRRDTRRSTGATTLLSQGLASSTPLCRRRTACPRYRHRSGHR